MTGDIFVPVNNQISRNSAFNKDWVLIFSSLFACNYAFFLKIFFKCHKETQTFFFYHQTEKIVGVKLLTRDFVSSAARRCMILANHFRKSQSACTKSFINLCGI